MSRNYYKSGEWNVICDVCGKKTKAADTKLRWDGLIVCPGDFEERHAQDFVKTRLDKILVPFVRPRPPDVFVDVPYNIYWDDGYSVYGYVEDLDI